MRWLSLMLVLLLPSLVLAQGYYADVNIIISETGIASISGFTNHPELMISETSDYTSKDGKYWTINITIKESFDDYVYSLVLPKGAVINYLKTPTSVRISEESGCLTITASGSNETLHVIIQYVIQQDLINYNWLWLMALPVILIIYWFVKKRVNVKKIDYSLLTERETMIMKLVVKRKRITQKTLMKELGIPRSAVSRNINSLKRKELILKQKKGMTNVITLK